MIVFCLLIMTPAVHATAIYVINPTTSVIVGYTWFNDDSFTDCLTTQFDMNF